MGCGVKGIVILEIKNLSVAYKTVHALQDVSFSLYEGDYFCIVGPNGSGKSSLLNGILGLAAVTGEVIFHIDKNEVAYLPQTNVTTQQMPATVFEVIMTGRQRKQNKIPFYSKTDYNKACEAMELLDISYLKNRKINELSGGQKQRVNLARALCREPELLILDEPCAGLDEQVSGNLYEFLHGEHKKGLTILMVSHDLPEVKKYANCVAVMDGKLLFEGSTEQWIEFRKSEAEVI